MAARTEARSSTSQGANAAAAGKSAGRLRCATRTGVPRTISACVTARPTAPNPRTTVKSVMRISILAPRMGRASPYWKCIVMIIIMHEVNISGLDLNLVPALDALLRHRDVTRAADDVGLSQPAMSRALARLRDLQNDPLLMRTRGGYVLTPRARA